MGKYKYRCVICPSVFKKDEMSFRDENEYDLDLCHKCLDGQREIDQEQLDVDDVDLDGIGDFREEIREVQELERRGIENRLD